jgi:hypothetical protein
MSETIGKVTAAKKPVAAELEYQGALAKTIINNKGGWSVDAYDKGDTKKLTDWMTKLKKDAEFCVSFDGGTAKYFVRVGTGSEKIPYNSLLVSSIKGHEARFKLLDWLQSVNGATSAQVNAFKERDPQD